MQALSDSQHARLSRLAGAYQQRHAEAFKAASKRNPHLWVDTLCFQPYGDALIGVLITPLALLLARLAASEEDGEVADGDRRIVELPSGRYLMSAECLDPDIVWHCELLDDLRDLKGPTEASRLAQQVMERVMAPIDDNVQ
nr:[NiFe]-hydrogenase assembly chaperone HybE [uncultured Halomonas sp.]